ncbi:Gfo/Idh/MocA family protein [Cohnella rhizosphaerae]|uniref:Gfo/Idh/MocA family oxidoreductase n=1 Tax=Cohnella rhizosphaerae TaxID=1457232 RepID=A0A9X4L686_9BACL|nr:Gfo/Idh/MocA family oxidoreductase [Cohnella rhizosphaerae]MDG0814252.1 Gfo/Idh/MocA family oxidoreductase [Cohnella rhizosphaerae]
MKKLKVGMIGLGEIAQIIHLPILQSMPDRFELVALCDVSPGLLALMGEKHRVEHLYASATEMLDRVDMDAVFVLNNMEYHTECAVAALKKNVHVFVEKPMCISDAEAEQIILARDASQAQVMVGYMRRFAPAYMRALEEVKALGPINYARVRDMIGPNAFFTGQSGIHVHRFGDLPAEAVQDRKDRNARLMKEAIGEASAEAYAAYGLLLGLNSHDFSAMREMLGMPLRVKAASSRQGGRFKNAILEYDGFDVMFETGVDQQGRFDAHIEVYGERRSVLVQYDTPYLRQLPTTLRIRDTIGDSLAETVVRPTYKDAYTCELEYFYEVVANGLTPKTTPEDYRQDLKVVKMIMEAIGNEV